MSGLLIAAAVETVAGRGGGGSDQVQVVKIEPQVRPIDTTLFDFSHLASDLRIGQVTSSTRFIMQML